MNSSQVKTQIEELTGEMLLLSLLGKIAYTYPEEEQREWLQALIESEAFSEAPLAANQEDLVAGLDLLNQWCKAGLDDKAFKELQADYLNLFVGPDKVIAAPYESVYFNDGRQTFQEQTLQVRSWYRRYGLEPEQLYHEPDDHIGLELIFVAQLTGQALQAHDEGKEQDFSALLEARQQFLSEHPLKWGFAWCDLVKANAQTDFYKGLGYLTRGALLSLAQQYELQAANEVAR